MGGDDDGEVPADGEPAQQPGDLVVQGGVESGGRLVQQENLRGAGEGEGYAALLAAGQGGGPAVGDFRAGGQTALGEQLGDVLFARVGGEFGNQAAYGHAGVEGGAGFLADVRDGCAPQPAQLVGG